MSKSVKITDVAKIEQVLTEGLSDVTNLYILLGDNKEKSVALNGLFTLIIGNKTLKHLELKCDQTQLDFFVLNILPTTSITSFYCNPMTDLHACRIIQNLPKSVEAFGLSEAIHAYRDYTISVPSLRRPDNYYKLKILPSFGMAAATKTSLKVLDLANHYDPVNPDSRNPLGSLFINADIDKYLLQTLVAKKIIGSPLEIKWIPRHGEYTKKEQIADIQAKVGTLVQVKEYIENNKTIPGHKALAQQEIYTLLEGFYRPSNKLLYADPKGWRGELGGLLNDINLVDILYQFHDNVDIVVYSLFQELSQVLDTPAMIKLGLSSRPPLTMEEARVITKNHIPTEPKDARFFYDAVARELIEDNECRNACQHKLDNSTLHLGLTKTIGGRISPTTLAMEIKLCSDEKSRKKLFISPIPIHSVDLKILNHLESLITSLDVLVSDRGVNMKSAGGAGMFVASKLREFNKKGVSKKAFLESDDMPELVVTELVLNEFGVSSKTIQSLSQTLATILSNDFELTDLIWLLEMAGHGTSFFKCIDQSLLKYPQNRLDLAATSSSDNAASASCSEQKLLPNPEEELFQDFKASLCKFTNADLIEFSLSSQGWRGIKEDSSAAAVADVEVQSLANMASKVKAQEDSSERDIVVADSGILDDEPEGPEPIEQALSIVLAPSVLDAGIAEVAMNIVGITEVAQCHCEDV